MKVIIAGGRDITDAAEVYRAIEMSGFHITEVVEGGALGVDRIGRQWAKDNNVPFKTMKADWLAFGKSAGPIRNGKMAAYADALILVWTGDIKSSPGSNNMLKQAREHGLKIHIRLVEKNYEKATH